MCPQTGLKIVGLLWIMPTESGWAKNITSHQLHPFYQQKVCGSLYTYS